MNYLYSEDNDGLKHYILKLRKLLTEPYVREKDKKEKVLFFLPCTSFLVDSVSSLIFKYVSAGKETIVVLPLVDKIINEGRGNIEQMVELIEKMETTGAKCYSSTELGLYSDQYAIIFFCNEYSGRLPLELRKASRFVVALQTTAMYTHVYLYSGRYEENFSEQIREEIDYLVTSEYVADWICERDNAWNDKLLRFGYPKLDALYHTYKDGVDIPEDWKRRIAGKKVFLFTTRMRQSWLDAFDNTDDRIAIWRPQPSVMSMPEKKAEIEEIGEKYNIIIDDTVSYYAAFWISDAMITRPPTSLIINYMYNDKPICLFDNDEVRKMSVVDYRLEPWYQGTYIAANEQEVLEFVSKVRYGEELMNEKQMSYRKQITNNFDGKVCERIYSFFEKIG